MNTTKKTFYLKDDDNKLGKYISKTPKSAAKKAFSKLFKRLQMVNNNLNNSSKFIIFTIVNKDNNKEYKYIGKRIKLAKPIKVFRNNKEILYKYTDIIGKYKNDLDL